MTFENLIQFEGKFYQTYSCWKSHNLNQPCLYSYYCNGIIVNVVCFSPVGDAPFSTSLEIKRWYPFNANLQILSFILIWIYIGWTQTRKPHSIAILRKQWKLGILKAHF